MADKTHNMSSMQRVAYFWIRYEWVHGCMYVQRCFVVDPTANHDQQYIQEHTYAYTHK